MVDKNKFGQALASALMTGGDSISGIYGQRGNTYATYLDAQTKRQAMEVEAIKAQQLLAQQAIENQQKDRSYALDVQKTIQSSNEKFMNKGMSPLLTSNASQIPPAALMQRGGARDLYGQTFVPNRGMSQTPVFGVGEGGNIQQIGSMPKGGKFVSPASMVTTPEKEASAIRIATAKNDLPTADMKNAMVGTKQFSALVSDLKAQAYGLKGGYSGMIESGKAFANRGKGKSSEYKLYLDTLPSASVSVYRGLTGDTRLSDADAKARALPLMWNPSEHTDVRDKKFAFLERMATAREKLLSEGKYKADKDGNVVIPLEDLKKEAESSSSSTFKPGDERVKDGITYVRQGDGKWHPKS